MTGYLDQYSSNYDPEKDEDFSIDNKYTTGFSNFWSNSTPFSWGFEDYETKHKRKIIEKTASIFEDLTKRKIAITVGGKDGKTHISSNGLDYQLHVDLHDEGKEIKTKTLVERSLAHVMVNSPIGAMGLIADRETRNPKVPRGYEPYARSAFTSIFDTLEDRRSQSIYGKQYTGFDIRNNDARKVEGKDFIGIPKDPVTALLYAEKGRDDLVEKSKFKQATSFIQKANRTTAKGIAKITCDYYHKVVEPWLITEMKLHAMAQHELNDKTNEEEIKKRKKRDNTENKEPSDDSGTEKQKVKLPTISELDIEQSNIFKKVLAGETLHQQTDHCNLNTEDKDNLDQVELSKVNLDKEQELAVQAEGDLEKALDDLASSSEGGGFTPERHYASVFNQKNFQMQSSLKYIDKTSARKLTRIFKRIMASTKMMLSDEGTEIDTEALIDAKIKGYGEFMRDEETSTGFDIIVGVDESGSMKGSKINAVKVLCATMFKALENVPNVNFEVIGWTDSLTIRHIKNILDVDNLAATGGTPFSSAICYCTKYILELQSRKKVFFMVTDGLIDDYEAELAEKAVAHLRKNKVKCVGIFVGSNYVPPLLAEAFGDEKCIGFADYSKFKDFVTNDVSKMVQRYLKRT